MLNKQHGVWPAVPVWMGGRQENLFPLARNGQLFFGCPACSLVTLPTALSQFMCYLRKQIDKSAGFNDYIIRLLLLLLLLLLLRYTTLLLLLQKPLPPVIIIIITIIIIIIIIRFPYFTAFLLALKTTRVALTKQLFFTLLPKNMLTIRHVFGIKLSALQYIRGGAVKSLARLTSRCRRAESIVSSERGVCSCAELQVFSCYRGCKEACQAMRAISITSGRELSSSFFSLQVKAPKEIHAILKEILGGTCTIVCHSQKLGGPV